VAKIIPCSPDTVRRHHRTWTIEGGFPAAQTLPGVRGLRWSEEAVLQWKLQAASGENGATTDWDALAETRGALLDAGIDPDTMQAFS